MANGSEPAPAGDVVSESSLLRLLEGAAKAANESATVEEAAGAVLAEACRCTGWPVAQLYVAATDEAKALLPTSTRYVADLERFERLRPLPDSAPLRPGDGLAGRVLAAGHPLWATDSGEYGDVFGSGPLRELGVRSGFAFPVFAGDGVVAVVEFLSDQAIEPDPDKVRVLTGVGHHLARVAERERAARALEDWKGRYHALERSLAAQALHDPLTSLPNRNLLLDRLQQALGRADRVGASVAVLSLDLDDFKAVNANFGHDGGDRVLVAVAERLQAALRPGDTLARMGGDEFAVLCDDVPGPTQAAEMAERVLAAFAAPFVVDRANVAMRASVGVAVATGGQKAYDRLVQDAHVAMHRAKSRRDGGYEVFDETMRVAASDRLALEHELRQAVDEAQFRLYYQPIVVLGTGEPVGVEALVRWDHPTRGLLPPGQFIGVAEDTGLIVPLGRWVLGEACAQAQAWAAATRGGAGPRMSVNVSGRQFQETGWIDEVASAVATSGIQPGQLVLEITESVLMEHTESTAERLSALKELGVRIAIDDFGTGYSSLGYLRRFPVDILKIDKSFIDGVTEGPHESALARAVVKLAATLGLEAVAEGLSTRKQLVTLRRLRCPLAQGFYFSEPKPADDITGLLASGRSLDPSFDDPALPVTPLGD